MVMNAYQPTGKRLASPKIIQILGQIMMNKQKGMGYEGTDLMSLNDRAPNIGAMGYSTKVPVGSLSYPRPGPFSGAEQALSSMYNQAMSNDDVDDQITNTVAELNYKGEISDKDAYTLLNLLVTAGKEFPKKEAVFNKLLMQAVQKGRSAPYGAPRQ